MLTNTCVISHYEDRVLTCLLFVSFFTDFTIIIASYFQLCVLLFHVYHS